MGNVETKQGIQDTQKTGTGSIAFPTPILFSNLSGLNPLPDDKF